MVISRLLGTMFPKDPVYTAIADIFQPLQEISDSLAQRTVAYVYDGSDPAVLVALDNETDPDLSLLMAAPGRDQSGWRQFSVPRSKNARSVLDYVYEQRAARARFYANPDLTPTQLGRLGRVWAVVGEGPDREAAGVPPWLMALVTDVGVAGKIGRQNGGFSIDDKRFPTELNRWTPEFLLDIAKTQDLDSDDTPVIVLHALFQEPAGAGYVIPNKAASLPGISEFVRDRHRALPATVMNPLVAEGRIHFLNRINEDATARDHAVHIIVELATSTASTVRKAALAVLEQVSLDVLSAVVPPALARVSLKQAEPIIAQLTKTEPGAAVVAQALELNPALAAHVQRLEDRRVLLAEQEDSSTEFSLPPFEPLPDEVPAQAIDELRNALARWLAIDDKHGFYENLIKGAASVQESDITEMVEVAEGRRSGPARITTLIKRINVTHAVTSLNTVHLLRLYPSGYNWRIVPGQDVRIVAEAFQRTGAPIERLNHWIATSYAVDPADVWMWVYENPQLMHEWLQGKNVIRALEIMAEYQHIPAEFLPQLAIYALGTTKATRQLARSILTGHPVARRLAEEGLADSKADMRRAAAEWLQTLGDQAAIPALENALKKERREVVRAALLTTLESLGVSITEYLAPTVLAAEAAKGLKAKTPVAVNWFDPDTIPAMRWANGDAVDPSLMWWWIVLAVKLKDPDGSGLLDRYLSLLHPDDAAELGRFCLQAWFGHDTAPPSEDECREHGETAGRREWQSWQNMAERVQQNPYADPTWLETTLHHAARPVESFIQSHYEEWKNSCVGSAINAKGMLALTTRMPGQEIITVLDAYTKRWASRRAQIEALTIALYGNGDPMALQKLLAMARRFKQATVQAKAQELVEQLADKRGWTTDQLADRTIPEAGFDDDGLLHLDYGAREFIGRMTSKGTIELSTADGKTLKSLPTPRQSDDEELAKEAKKQLTASRKELKSVVELQTARLYEAMCTERQWQAEEWHEFLRQHPLMKQLVSRLVWVHRDGENSLLFRPAEDGSLLDINDEPVELGAGAEVRLAHRVLMSAKDAAAWKQHLSDYHVTVLFDQFAAELPEFDPRATEFEQWKGHLTDSFSIRAVANKRGYQRDLDGESWFIEYAKEFKGLGLTLVLEFTGSYVPEENIPAAIETMAVRQRKRAIPLGEVPRVLLAECWADYSAFGALGHYDPDYRAKV